MGIYGNGYTGGYTLSDLSGGLGTPSPVVSGLTTTSLTEDTTPTLANPERGFFNYQEAHYRSDNSGFTALDSSAMASDRTTNGHSLVFRYYYIEKYRATSTIEQTYLNLLATDLAAVRTAGCKIIVRFAYSDTYITTPPYNSDNTPANTRSQIQQVSSVLNTYADVVHMVQAGFIGTWGEWFYSDNFTTGSDPNVLTSQNITDRNSIIDTWLTYLNPEIFLGIRYIGTIMTRYNSAPPPARIGHHNDALWADDGNWGTYTSFVPSGTTIAQARSYLAAMSKVPVGHESANYNPPMSDWANASAEMATYHTTFLNPLYYGATISAWGSNIDIAKRRLGYRIVASAVRTKPAAVGTNLRVEVDLTNNGWAWPTSTRDMVITVDNQSGNRIDSIVSGADFTSIGPGTSTTLWADIPIPAGTPTGTYRVAAWLPDSHSGIRNRPEYAIRLLNVGIWDSTRGYNNLTSVNIQTTTTISALVSSTAVTSTSLTSTASTTNLYGSGYTVHGYVDSGIIISNVNSTAQVSSTLTGIAPTTNLYGSGYVAYGYVATNTVIAQISSTTLTSSSLTTPNAASGSGTFGSGTFGSGTFGNLSATLTASLASTSVATSSTIATKSAKIVSTASTISLLNAITSASTGIIATSTATSSFTAKKVLLAPIIATASVTSLLIDPGPTNLYGSGYTTKGYVASGIIISNINSTAQVSSAFIGAAPTTNLYGSGYIAYGYVASTTVIASVTSTTSTIGLLNASTSASTGIIATSTTISFLTGASLGSTSVVLIARGILNPSGTVQRPGSVSLTGSGLLLATETTRRSMGGGLTAWGILSTVSVGPDLYPGLSILFTEIQGLADINLESLGTATLFV